MRTAWEMAGAGNCERPALCAAVGLAVTLWVSMAQAQLVPATVTNAQPPELAVPLEPTERPEPEERAAPFVPSPEFQRWINDLVREHIPHEYEKRKNWGHTDQRFDGLSVRLDDGQIKTHRKFKAVNDGAWTMYRAELTDPDEQFHIDIGQMEELSGGRIALPVTVVAQMRVMGRRSLWQKGVQVFSISAEADTRVRLAANLEIGTRLDPTTFPPAMRFSPRVAEARLAILDFRLRRVSKFDGPVVRSLSDSVRELLEEKLAEDNAKLVGKLNKQLAKQDDKFAISFEKFLPARAAAPSSQPAE
jgi:hypothetical protein